MNRLPLARKFVALSLVLAISPAAWAADAIDEIKDVSPERAAFAAAKRGEPLELKTAEAIAKYFGADAAAKLQQQVDLSEQVVLLFAWRGSGQDKLSYEVLESAPEQIRFHLKPGRTRDLRPHVRIFALRANVKWSVE